MTAITHPTTYRQLAGSPQNAGAWNRTRMMLLLAAVLLGVVTLIVGLAYAVFTTLTAASPAPTAPNATSVAPANLPFSTVNGPGLEDNHERRDAIAAEPMHDVAPADARQGEPAAITGATITVPAFTREGPAGVPTGFPRTPAGAIGQLAAIETTVLQGMSITDTNAIYRAWALPGGVGVADWEMTRNVQAFLTATGKGSEKDLTTVVVATPAAGQIKGTDGPGWVLACVLLDVRASITAEAHIGYGYCERMQWTEDRWLIAPGGAAAPAPSTWPGTDLAAVAGWRTWVDR